MTKLFSPTHRWPTALQEKLRSEVLELLVCDASLSDVLKALTEGIAGLQVGLSCAVLLLDHPVDGAPACLRLGASTNLPAFFVSALDGLQVTNGNGGCATAAFSAERVIVSDISLHPYWTNYRELATRAGLGACWSQPMLAAGQQVVGVLSVYHRTPQNPHELDLVTLAQLAKLASLAVVQRRAAQQLQESEARFRALAEHTSEAILVHQNTRIVYVNPAAIKLFGAQTAQDLLGTCTTDRIHPDHMAQQLKRLRNIISHRTTMPLVESRFLRLDGTALEVEVQGTTIVFDGQESVHVSIRDITKRKFNEQRLKVAASVFGHALEGILITTVEGIIVEANQAFIRITGYPRDELLGRNPRLLGSGHHDKMFYANFWQSLMQQGQWSGELWNRRKNGEVYVQLQHISAVFDDQSKITHFVALCSDITSRKAQEARLDQLAHFDILTGLPNRRLKADRLRQAMTQTVRRGLRLALVYIDLDGFKAINDTYGHAAGDHLLVSLAQRMKQVLRNGDTLARIGGDEFAAILVDLEHEQESNPLLQRLLNAASEPVSFGDLTLQVSASLGVTFYPQVQDMTSEDLLNQADHAMYRAKKAGKNQHHVHGQTHILMM